MAIECLVLGAGQEVGKSCAVVTIGGKRVMFDCGMHMGHHDCQRYPDFARILAAAPGAADFTSAISCVVITHFHLDHIGALPYFTEVCGYNGPIYMTYPTKALAPLMLEDYRKVMVDHRGEEEQYSYEDIQRCMKKVIPMDLKQTIQVDRDLVIRAYYAGHVLGAAMIYAKVGDAAMVYTGDYNMTPDRHLGAAQIDRLKLDLLITDFGVPGVISPTLSGLLASLTPAVLGHVQMLKTSAQVWEALDRTFASRSKARIMQLRTALVKPKRRDVSMSSYCNNTKRIADTMAAIGSPLGDDEIVSYVLAGLGDDYDNFTTSMAVLAGNDDFTLSDLYGHMTAYEARTGDRSSGNNNQFQYSANNAARGGGRGGFARGGGGRGRGDGGRGNGGGRHNGGYNNGNGGYHGNGGNGGYQGGGHGGGRGDNSGRDGNALGGGRGRGDKSTCQICGIYGHDAVRCYQRFNHGIQPETGASSRAAHYSNANDAYTNDPNWYLDSGATDHMTNDLERLHTHENYRGNEQIQVANGSHHEGNSASR